MDKEKLRRHKRNRAELDSVGLAIERLRGKLKDVEVVSGKVKKSSDGFPYIEEYLTVQVPDPKQTEPIWARIRKKEQRKAELEAEIQEVEMFIAGLPDGMDKQIFEMVYLDGISQQMAGEAIGYTQARVSQIIHKWVK